MEAGQHKLIQQYASDNFELRKLYNRHKEIEEELKKLENQTYITEPDRSIIKTLKLEKLQGVERMLQILKEINS